jgi:hypothetical protein
MGRIGEQKVTYSFLPPCRYETIYRYSNQATTWRPSKHRKGRVADRKPPRKR